VRPLDLGRRLLERTSRDRGTAAPTGDTGAGADAPTERREPNVYEAMYEAHARTHPGPDGVGSVSSFELFGRKELAVLQMEGLRPTDTFVDLGCGVGRLALHLIPWLDGGHYVGTDVAPSMLQQAEAIVGATVSSPPCTVRWVLHDGTAMPMPDGSVDMFGAFSVFTHIEHEDTYNVLRDSRRAARPGARFVLSCLPLDLAVAREIFIEQASVDFRERWGKVRNVVTTVDLLESVARMAGWSPLRWYRGDERTITGEGLEGAQAFGQSICVLGTDDPQ
jgi:SAM-dependent methyltransferase